MNRDLKYNSGFTLLEIVIAMLILSIVTAGTYGLFVTNYKFLTEAKHRLQAVNQASTVLERLRIYVSSHSDVPVGAGEAFSNGTSGMQSPTVIGLGGQPEIEGAVTGSQTWDYVVSDVAHTDCKKVTVTVRWGEV